ncbi:MAG TPA: Asp-tRNA(Asn)/Glu-tRNA(Gln) amidotransferase subunit GatA [Thermodesulfobacteriota bacterium]|nr:Asp-tRNA(Asn)/Glu-tRNA(Gln) amidotransferase subunit GatA [Thermodesulfobacteriota bacterium]
MTLPFDLTIAEAHERLIQREISSVELTRAVLDRIFQVEPQVGAFITVTPEAALKQAEEADRRIASKKIFPLTGIPLAIKDLISTKGIRTTCASRILEHYVPPYDATVITRLRELGAVMVGKVNLDEFAMGSSTENSALQVTRNPWNPDYIPGGSSGGSAAAVSAGECLGALGSDTGGSIRQPAAHCGVVGLKPTYGRVSRYGLVAYASSLDQIGPLAKTVTDCAILLQALAGYDPRDSTSVPRDVPDYLSSVIQGIRNRTIGIPKEYFVGGLDPEVEQALRQAIKVLEKEGARCLEITLPHTEYAIAVYYIIAMAEASSNLARYDGVKYGFRDRESRVLMDMVQKTRSLGFGPEVVRRILLGTYVLSAGYYDAYFRKASQVRTLIIQDYRQAFDQVDLILTPVAPTTAFRRGEKTDDPLQMYLTDIFTISANLAGIPGLALPCGFSSQGLPIGLQILGNHFEEEKILQAGWAFEQATDFHLRRPPL